MLKLPIGWLINSAPRRHCRPSRARNRIQSRIHNPRASCAAQLLLAGLCLCLRAVGLGFILSCRSVLAEPTVLRQDEVVFSGVRVGFPASPDSHNHLRSHCDRCLGSPVANDRL